MTTYPRRWEDARPTNEPTPGPGRVCHICLGPLHPILVRDRIPTHLLCSPTVIR